MTKKCFYAAAYAENPEGRFYSAVVRFSTADNIASLVKRYKAVNLCATRKEAVDLACKWDYYFLLNGTFGGVFPLNSSGLYPNSRLFNDENFLREEREAVGY